MIRQSCCNFIFSHGVTITKVLLVTTMLVKLNFNSMIYLVYFYRLYKIEYYPSRFLHKQTEPETFAKKQRAAIALGGLIIWTSLFILMDYFVFVFYSFSKGGISEGSAQANLVERWQ